MRSTFALLAIFFLQGCEQQSLPTDSDLTAETIAYNNQFDANITSNDVTLSQRGLIASTNGKVVNDAGEEVWNLDNYAFLESDKRDDRINPSLWRQAKLNTKAGLYRVNDNIFQLRGFDLANLSLVKSDNGYILVDPLTSIETANTALDFAELHIDDFSVSAIIVTHSHIDHFGGIKPVLDRYGDVPIYAPAGFLEEALSENIFAGIAMQRRAEYMYGRTLPQSAQGHIDNGLGKMVPFNPEVSIAAPTVEVTQQFENHTIDGVTVDFFTVSGSEAPAEFVFYFHRDRAFMGAELVSQNQHNVYTLRGAKVRDARLWANFIDDIDQRWGAESDIYFASHHWPIWGTDQIREFLKVQRDTYRYIHDQTLRWANQGYNPIEIAEKVKLPDALMKHVSARGYYGTVSHNVRAVYQFYFGFYDGNPANLEPLSSKESARRHVELMGGRDNTLLACKEALANDELKWGSTLCNYLVINDPDDIDARETLAAIYTQRGYRAESGPWRNVFLSGAMELKEGPKYQAIDMSKVSEMLKAMPISYFLDTISVRIKAENAIDHDLDLVLSISDINEHHHLTLSNGVLIHRPIDKVDSPTAQIITTHELLVQLMTGAAGISELMGEQFSVEGSRLHVLSFLRLIDQPDGKFPLVHRHD